MQNPFPQDSEPNWAANPPSLEELQPRPSKIAEQSTAVLPVQFDPATHQVLEELADGGSIGDALRDAIALSKWFKDIRESGANIFIERNGKFHKVVKIR